MNTQTVFPNAPTNWSVDEANAIAHDRGLELTNDHMELIGALQEYYKKVEFPKLRQIKDALDEKFHNRGGMQFLYKILPGGPVAQGCELAGLNVPAGVVDKSFGSVA